jgi:hypothetical protein
MAQHVVIFLPLNLLDDQHYHSCISSQIWKIVNREKHEKNLTITGMAWHPKLPHIAYCDNHGYLGLLKNVISMKSSNVHQVGATSYHQPNSWFTCNAEYV